MKLGAILSLPMIIGRNLGIEAESTVPASGQHERKLAPVPVPSPSYTKVGMGECLDASNAYYPLVHWNPNYVADPNGNRLRGGELFFECVKRCESAYVDQLVGITVVEAYSQCRCHYSFDDQPSPWDIESYEPAAAEMNAINAPGKGCPAFSDGLKAYNKCYRNNNYARCKVGGDAKLD